MNIITKKDKGPYIIGIIVVLVAIIVGFYVGTVYQRRQPVRFGSAATPMMRGMWQRPMMGRRMMGRQFAPMGRGVAGQITGISGNQITVKLNNGNTQTVTLSNTTNYTKTETTNQSALQQGDNVIIAGQPAQDGSINAQTIRINTIQMTPTPPTTPAAQ